MKLEFNVFDIKSFNTSEYWTASCVFILEDGRFVEGELECVDEGDIYYRFYNPFTDQLDFNDELDGNPKYYMFKD